MKKLISILLALTFVVSAMAFTVSAADEYYLFSLEEGLVSNSGLQSNCVAGTYQLTPNSTTLRVKAWAVAATGIKEVKYNFNDNGWVVLPETAFVARPDVYDAATGIYGVPAIGQNVSVAPLTPGFEISIPTSELGLVLDSTYIFQIAIVTNAGEEILIADLTVPYVEYSVSTEPQGWITRGNCHVSLDGVAALLNGASANANVSTSKVVYNPGKVDTINFYGWISVDQAADFETTAFGYSVDDGEIVYGAYSSPTGSDVIEAGSYDYDSRFDIYADVAGLELGTHTVKFYCQLSNGEQIIMNTVTAEVTDVREENVPAGIKNGIDSFTASSACNFDYDQYLDGSDLTQPSSNFAGGSPFRAEWSPRPVLAAGMTVKVDAETGNKYGSIWGFNTHYSDHDWEGAYTFTAAVKVDDARAESRGMFVNFSGSEQLDGANNPPLYEHWCEIEGGYNVAGTSGINVLFPNADTMIVAVPTFNDAAAEGENAKGAIFAMYNLPGTFGTFATVDITDDNNGNVFVSVNGEVISKVTYADAGMFAHTYDQGYYKTATIWDYNNGGVVAETDKALIWKYKTVGFGTRSIALAVDNIQIVPAKAVTEPEVKVPEEPDEPVIPEPPVVVAPEAITFVEGSKYSIDAKSGILLLKMANFTKGENLSVFMSNIAIDPAFYQVINANGEVVTSVTRFVRGYSIQLLDANGAVVKTHPIAVIGDSDNNGRIGASDATAIKSAVAARPSNTTVEFWEANADGNTRIAPTDATFLKQVIAAKTW